MGKESALDPCTVTAFDIAAAAAAAAGYGGSEWVDPEEDGLFQEEETESDTTATGCDPYAGDPM